MLAWDKVCFLKSCGGEGIPNFEDRNVALGAKLAWKLYSHPSSLWATIIRGKYIDSNLPERIFTIQDPLKGSQIWNFVLKCRQIILPNLTWLIHDGKTTRFWEDSWNGFVPLEIMEEIQDLKNILKNEWGVLMCNYFQESFSNGFWHVKWRDFWKIRASACQIKMLQETLKLRKIFYNNSADKLVCLTSKTRSYKVKDGYRILSLRKIDQNTRIFSFCYNFKGLQKACTFAWLPLKGIILKSERLKKLGIVENFNCVLCNKDLEITDHLLLNCEFANDCWKWLMEKLGWCAPFHSTIHATFESWPKLCPQAIFRIIWEVSPAILI